LIFLVPHDMILGTSYQRLSMLQQERTITTILISSF